MRSGFVTLMGTSELRAARVVDNSNGDPRIVPISESGSRFTRDDANDSRRSSFAREQVHRLVRQVFLQDDPLAPRQVVFSAVDSDTDVAGICQQVAQTLSTEVGSSVALVDANVPANDVAAPSPEGSTQRWAPLLRTPDRQISDNLWRISSSAFWRNRAGESSARQRLGDLQLEFEYGVFQAPAVDCSGLATLLASKCDGLVLVLEANLTRKLAAQNATQVLQNAKVKLLGTVLSGRTFPIPEAIYRRL